MIVVEDDVPAAKTTEQAGKSCHDRVKRSPSTDQPGQAIFRDPAGGVKAGNEG